jgi:hypothetical protein
MSFTQRAKTPKNTKIKFLATSQNHYNSFNNANLSSIREKIKKKSYNLNYNNFRPNSSKYNTFLKSSAPFKYCNNINNKDSLVVYYNGGPRKQFCPLITRENLSQYLKNRSTSFRFKRPCGCYSNVYSSKYIQEYQYPNYERKEHYNTFCKENNLPNICDNENIRHSKGFMSPQILTRKNGKITYKLKGNLDDDKYRINTESNNYTKNKNIEVQEQVEKKEKEEINDLEYEEKQGDINEKKEEEESNDLNNEKNQKKKYNIFNIRPRRRFHKVQIFNNCKPFLVDDFKDYGYYE